MGRNMDHSLQSHATGKISQTQSPPGSVPHFSSRVGEVFFLQLTRKEFWIFPAQTACVTEHMTHTIHMGKYRNNENMVAYICSVSSLKW